MRMDFLNNPCWFVDSEGEIFKTTVGRAGKLGDKIKGATFCKTEVQAKICSERIAWLKYLHGLNNSPFSNKKVDDDLLRDLSNFYAPN